MVSVAMLPLFGLTVGGEHVSHSCSVDRKPEARDKLLTEKELDPLFLLISFQISFLFYCLFLQYGRGGRQPALLLKINYRHYLFKYPRR